MNFGEKLKIFRQTMGITQESLASELHVSAQAVSKWERQENLPDLVLVPRIAELLGVSCDVIKKICPVIVPFCIWIVFF